GWIVDAEQRTCDAVRPSTDLRGSAAGRPTHGAAVRWCADWRRRPLDRHGADLCFRPPGVGTSLVWLNSADSFRRQFGLSTGRLLVRGEFFRLRPGCATTGAAGRPALSANPTRAMAVCLWVVLRRGAAQPDRKSTR